MKEKIKIYDRCFVSDNLGVGLIYCAFEWFYIENVGIELGFMRWVSNIVIDMK